MTLLEGTLTNVSLDGVHPLVSYELYLNTSINTSSDSAHDDLVPGAGSRILYIVYLCLVVIIGVPGNIIVAVVYGRTTPKSACDFLILTMGITDACVCCSSPLILMRSELHASVPWMNRALCCLEYWLQLTAMITSCVILVIIAMDRYIKICKPKLPSLTPITAKHTCIFSVIFCGAFCAYPSIRAIQKPGCLNTNLRLEFSVRVYFTVLFAGFALSFVLVTFAYGNVCKQISEKIKIKQRLIDNMGLKPHAENQIKEENAVAEKSMPTLRAWRQMITKWRNKTRIKADISVEEMRKLQLQTESASLNKDIGGNVSKTDNDSKDPANAALLDKLSEYQGPDSIVINNVGNHCYPDNNHFIQDISGNIVANCNSSTNPDGRDASQGREFIDSGQGTSLVITELPQGVVVLADKAVLRDTRLPADCPQQNIVNGPSYECQNSFAGGLNNTIKDTITKSLPLTSEYIQKEPLESGLSVNSDSIQVASPSAETPKFTLDSPETGYIPDDDVNNSSSDCVKAQSVKPENIYLSKTAAQIPFVHTEVYSRKRLNSAPEQGIWTCETNSSIQNTVGINRPVDESIYKDFVNLKHSRSPIASVCSSQHDRNSLPRVLSSPGCLRCIEGVSLNSTNTTTNVKLNDQRNNYLRQANVSYKSEALSSNCSHEICPCKRGLPKAGNRSSLPVYYWLTDFHNPQNSELLKIFSVDDLKLKQCAIDSAHDGLELTFHELDQFRNTPRRVRPCLMCSCHRGLDEINNKAADRNACQLTYGSISAIGDHDSRVLSESLLSPMKQTCPVGDKERSGEVPVGPMVMGMGGGHALCSNPSEREGPVHSDSLTIDSAHDLDNSDNTETYGVSGNFTEKTPMSSSVHSRPESPGPRKENTTHSGRFQDPIELYQTPRSSQCDTLLNAEQTKLIPDSADGNKSNQTTKYDCQNQDGYLTVTNTPVVCNDHLSDAEISVPMLHHVDDGEDNEIEEIDNALNNAESCSTSKSSDKGPLCINIADKIFQPDTSPSGGDLKDTHSLAPPSRPRSAIRSTGSVSSRDSNKTPTFADPPQRFTPADTDSCLDDDDEVFSDVSTAVFFSKWRKCKERAGSKNSKTSKGSVKSTGSRRRFARERQMTYMLLSVTAAFILAWLPPWVLYLIAFWGSADPNLMVTSSWYHYLGSLHLVNYVASPIIYYVFNVTYRSKVKALYSPMTRLVHSCRKCSR